MDEKHEETGDAGPFGTIDARLNVFALANGMDLTKGAAHRRLEWFKEGLERGIRIDAEAAGSFGVRVMSWRTGAEESNAESSVGSGLTAEAIGLLLSDIIETANAL